jgi:DNA-binding transcriptional LysR family regulator
MSLSSLYLDAFYACAQIGHFTKASEKLAITQSALSQRIKNLEDELAVSLFIRDRAGLKLTEAGVSLLRYCQRKEALEDETVQTILNPENKGLKGIVRVGGYSSVMKSAVLPSLATLIESNLSIKIYFISREMYELPGLLRNGEIDFMLLDYEIQREDLVSARIGVERNILIQKKNYKGPEVYLDHDENDQTTQKYMSKFKNKLKYERSYYDDSYGIIEAVKLGLGKAVIPYHLIQDEKKLSIIDKDAQLTNPVVLHYYRQDFYTKLQQAVIESLVTGCERLLK